MYTVAEITKLTAISNNYVPYRPSVVLYKFYYGVANADIATWWSGAPFTVTEAQTSRTVITGVVYNTSINYVNKDTLADCLTDDQSFYWDDTNQILYVHYGYLHRIDPVALNFSYGVAIGLTNDKLRYFEDKAYMPFLNSFPNISQSVDKFNYDQMSFIVDTIVCDNRSGFFDQFKAIPLYGNLFQVKTGEDGDSYSELVERASLYIEDYNFSAKEFTLDIQDRKKVNTAQIPNGLFNDTDYPYIGESSIGKVIPFGYGSLHNVPGICVNEGAISVSVDPDFIFLEIITGSVPADMTVLVLDADDVWVEDTGISVNYTTGVVTVPNAKTLSGTTYGFFSVKADLDGIEIDFASDIIKDMNDRHLSITYDVSNYDTTEWESEEQFLKPIAFYMDTTKDIYDWITELQSLSTIGFRYCNTSNNKLSIRCDNPNRSVVANVPKVDVRYISDVVAEANIEDVYNKIQIGYNKSIDDDVAPVHENTDYYDLSFAIYKVTKVYNKISGLLTVSEAEDKASIQSEDYAAIRRVFEVEVIGEEYLDIKLYDVVTVDLSLLKKKIETLRVLIDTIGSNNDLHVMLTNTMTYQEVLNAITVTEVGEEYFGEIRGQVVGVQPNYDLRTNTIRIRERVSSDVFRSVYAGIVWSIGTITVNIGWTDICWSPELSLFVIVGSGGTGDKVLTSPDGITWTSRTHAVNNGWRSVCWSSDLTLFVAVSYNGTGNRVMTSPDGITWTSRTSATDNSWNSVCWSSDLTLFVAVSYNGTGNRVMTSPDGITWTSRTSAADNDWHSVCWSSDLTLFVAVSYSGTTSSIMTSPDGINWTIQTASSSNSWRSVCWSSDLTLFVAVASSGTGNRVMTSPDGIIWTSRTSAADNDWKSISWSSEQGLFVAVASSGTGNRVMTSPDGIIWTTRVSAEDNFWSSICWAPRLIKFVAVASDGLSNSVMTSL